MSSTESSSSESETSKSCSDFDVEEEDDDQQEADTQHGATGIAPYEDDPIASPEWQESYDRRRQEDAELLQALKRRLDGHDLVENW